MDYNKAADKLLDDVLVLRDGPKGTRRDAVKLLETALRQAYQAGRDQHQSSLADAMYPRNYSKG